MLKPKSESWAGPGHDVSFPAPCHHFAIEPATRCVLRKKKRTVILTQARQLGRVTRGDPDQESSQTRKSFEPSAHFTLDPQTHLAKARARLRKTKFGGHRLGACVFSKRHSGGGRNDEKRRRPCSWVCVTRLPTAAIEHKATQASAPAPIAPHPLLGRFANPIFELSLHLGHDPAHVVGMIGGARHTQFLDVDLEAARGADAPAARHPDA